MTNIPFVIENDGKTYNSYDIYSRLLKDWNSIPPTLPLALGFLKLPPTTAEIIIKN